MRIRLIFALSLSCLGMAACGGTDGSGGTRGDGGSGGNPVIPVSHTLAQAQAVTMYAKAFYGFEFLLPTQAAVHFSASETTKDTWDIAVFTPAEWVSYQNGSGSQAYDGIHTGVMSVSDTVTLPAGDWFLGFRCANSVQRCMFVFNADATY